MDKPFENTAGSSNDTHRKSLKGRQASLSFVKPLPVPEREDDHKPSRKSSKEGEILFKDPFAHSGKINPGQRPPPPGHRRHSKSQAPTEVDAESKDILLEREESPLGTLHILQKPVPVVDSRPALLIGLSGVSSFGKTTISHLLRLILPPSSPIFILHQDDFFIPKHLLVPSSTGELGADCQDAVDFAAFKKMLKYAKCEGSLPTNFYTMQSEEDERSLAVSTVDFELIDELKDLILRSGILEFGRPIGIVDGFLLYHNPTIRKLLDVKILLRASKEKSKTLRFQRPDYTGPNVGDEFFWRTPEYFEKVVWRNYSQKHSHLFEEGDPEGKPLETVCDSLRISVQPKLDQNVDDVLRWTVQSIVSSLTLPPREYDLCNCHSKMFEGFWRALNKLL